MSLTISQVELLHQGDATLVTRVRLGDGRTAITKTALGPDGVRRRNAERAILQRLVGISGVPQLLDVPCAENELVLADVVGTTLSALVAASRFEADAALTIDEVIGVAHQLADVLDEVHGRGVTHKDINPSNVLLTDDGSVCLLDFGLATVHSAELPAFVHETEIAGTLAYIAPEQTGRTGRSVDHRVDFYSLGATIYELVTGRAPFESNDALALIRDSLSIRPVDPSVRNPAVPKMLAAIIMRLLMKEPDDRYQSASGLKYDLYRLTLSRAGRQSGDFMLGERDFPQRLEAPNRLIGRDKEVEELRASFAKAVEDGGAAVFVHGKAGVGKSMLVDELRGHVTQHHGFMARGKFDQVRKQFGTSAVVEALSAWCQLLLAEPERTLSVFRSRIRSEVGKNLGLLQTVIPELSALMGTSSDGEDPAEVGSLSARVVQAEVALLRAVVTPNRPLVLVLDDVQWATQRAIDFIEEVAFRSPVSGLLLVCAYREDSLDEGNSLRSVLDRCVNESSGIVRISVDDLHREQLAEFLRDMLRLDITSVQSLADEIWERTLGNPFETVEFINALRTDGVLHLGENGWEWDDADIRAHLGSGDVLDIIAARVRNLPFDTQLGLQAIGYLGNAVTADILALAFNRSVEAIETVLEPALEAGLLVVNQSSIRVYRFRHDRVQQALLQVFAAGGLPFRLALARRLNAAEEHYLAAEQYLFSIDGVQNDDERIVVATLFQAAADASFSVNPVLAEQYLMSGFELLRDCRSSAPELYLQIVMDLHAVVASSARFEEASALFEDIQAIAEDPIDRAQAGAIQVQALMNCGKPREALALGLSLLSSLGVTVPEDLDRAVSVGIARLHTWLASHGGDAEAARPFTEDPHDLAVASVLQKVQPAAFFSGAPCAAWLILESLRLWIDNGPNAALGENLGPLVCVTARLNDDYRSAIQATARVLATVRRQGTRMDAMYAQFTYEVFARPWVDPYERVIEECRSIRDVMLQLNDVQHVMFLYGVVLPAIFETAPSLDATEIELAAASKFAAEAALASPVVGAEPLRQLISGLRGETSRFGSMDDDKFSFNRWFKVWRRSDLASLLAVVDVSILAVIFRNFQDADEWTKQAVGHLERSPGLYQGAVAYLLRGLVCCVMLRDGDGTTDMRGEVDRSIDWLRARSEDAPVNFHHLHTFLRAERAWLDGDVAVASTCFDQAVRAAKAASRPWHLALILEEAARFQLSLDAEHVARLLLRESYESYAQWGARGKVTQLETEFPFLRAPDVARGGSVSGSVGQERRTTGLSRTIDLHAILRASQALSSETALERLHERLVEVVREVVGATDVAMLLWNDETYEWMFPPGAEPGDRSVDQSGEDGDLPLSAFRYVERTGVPLLVEDAKSDERFSRDPYVQRRERCSLLVVPISSKRRLRAVIVAGNDLSSGAFTNDRLDTVTMIGSQLAVSLENALSERFRALVQGSSDVTLVVDHSGVIGYASTACESLLRKRQSEVVTRRLCEFFVVEEQEAIRRRIQDARSGRSEQLVARVDLPEKQVSYLELTFSDLSNEPAVNGVVVQLREVTEKHFLENELRRSQKLESVGQLAAGVAHELNTPIQFIDNNAKFLEKVFSNIQKVVSAATEGSGFEGVDLEFLLSEGSLAISQSLEGISRVAHIVQAMNAFGHPSNDVFAAADINQAIRNTLTIAHSRAKHVADVVEKLAEVPLVVCNISDINQCLLNLIVNGVQAMAEVESARGRGTLTVATRVDGPNVVIDISDTGGGIPVDIQDRIFEPFFTTKEVGVGTGQGLAITYSLIHDRHKGTLSFDSTQGVGTTFSIALPIAGPVAS